MTQFLQSSNVSLIAGALLLLVLMGIRTMTRDKDLRQDIRGAAVLVAVFIVLRVSGWLFEDHLSKSVASLFRLGWMLTFAFGTIRFAVGVALWVFRFQKKTPTPKIVRDVLSFTLYAL
ncbi:MAG: mechanosensitive ion channel protein MscS, partial [Myxococcaceae bacterium]